MGQPLDIHHQPVGIFQGELFRLEFAVQFERDAGVFVRGPGAHREYGGGLRQAGNDRKDEQRGRGADQASPGDGAPGDRGAA